MSETPATGGGRGAAYRVLARKYRPRTFEELIGQEALVRTLTNAIASGRIAHAFMLTGVRGVGKTTTARIIARALNCIGPDGNGGPTITPCGVCDPCRAIAEDRHVDVLEIDAASHTGVDDVRELTDGVRYGAVAARYKIYIIDEVHMLSKAAWNALLKTLEEPPPHVKFLFATTEIRKVPVTVLSRCQRFDLRRVAGPLLVEHFLRVAGWEEVTLERDAAALLARAADGSVRDGLSLLDQAIALGGSAVTLSQVRDMLGLADRERVLDLFESLIRGQPAEALTRLGELYQVGADPLVVLHDLLDFTHTLTRFRAAPETANDPAIPEAERSRGLAMAGRLAMPALARLWQMLLKGVGEVQMAPAPQQALEMVLIRLAYTADLPTPGELARLLASPGVTSGGSGGGEGSGGGSGPAGSGHRPQAFAAARALAAPLPAEAVSAPLPVAEPAVALAPDPADFPALVQLFADKGEMRLSGELFSAVHLVRLQPGYLEIRLAPQAPGNLGNRVAALLSDWTGHRWLVSLSQAPGQPTLAEQGTSAEAALRREAESHPVVCALMQAFPGARLGAVVDLTPSPSFRDDAPGMAAFAGSGAGGPDAATGFEEMFADDDGFAATLFDDSLFEDEGAL